METDSRIAIINSILTTPHGNILNLIPIHKEAMDKDPLFYIKFAHNYNLNNDIRDHKKIFASMILTSKFHEFRDIGGYLLLGMSPDDFLTVIKSCFGVFIKKEKIKVKGKQIVKKSLVKDNVLHGKTGGKKRRLQKFSRMYIKYFENEAEKGNCQRFLLNKKFLREIYRVMHIEPSFKAAASLNLDRDLKRSKSIGYIKNPYESFKIVRLISMTDSEERICELIAKYRLPALSVIGAIKNMTPAIASVLAETMSGKQLQNFMSMLQRKGLLENVKFKKKVENKLEKNADKLSMRSKVAAKTLGKDADIMEKSTDDFVKSFPMIKDKKILLCIDKSYSMQKAIAIGKEVAPIITSKIENPDSNLRMMSFNAIASSLLIPQKRDYSGFESIFKYMFADGGTSLGACIELCERIGFNPDTIVFITDGEETSHPLLENALQHSNLHGTKIIGCLVGDRIYDLDVSNNLIKERSFEVENIKFKENDYYSLPNLLKVISKGGMRDYVKEIDSIDINSIIPFYKNKYREMGMVL